MNQSEFEANEGNRPKKKRGKMRACAARLVAACLSLDEKVARVLLTNHRALLSIIKANTNYFDTQLKIALRRTRGLGADFYEISDAKGPLIYGA